MIFIAADHGGFKLKEHVKKALKERGLKFVDLGPTKLNPKDDYPDFAAKVAKKVSASPEKDQGILVCTSGQGMCIAANKFKNVRAALVWNIIEAKHSREHNYSNVLCLTADYTSPELAEKIMDTWFDTPWSDDERHKRRVNKISSLEK